MYAQTLIVVAFLVVNFFGFLVITRHHEGVERWYCSRMKATSPPDLPIPTRSLSSSNRPIVEFFLSHWFLESTCDIWFRFFSSWNTSDITWNFHACNFDHTPLFGDRQKISHPHSYGNLKEMSWTSPWILDVTCSDVPGRCLKARPSDVPSSCLVACPPPLYLPRSHVSRSFLRAAGPDFW